LPGNNQPVDTPPFPLNTTFNYNSSWPLGDRLGHQDDILKRLEPVMNSIMGGFACLYDINAHF